VGDQFVAQFTTCTTQYRHNRRKTMPSVELEPPIPAIEWLQTYALDSTATGTE